MQNGLLCVVEHFRDVVQCLCRTFHATFDFWVLLHYGQDVLDGRAINIRMLCYFYPLSLMSLRRLLNSPPNRFCCRPEPLAFEARPRLRSSG